MSEFDYELGQNFDRDTPANERAESDKYWDSDSQFLDDAEPSMSEDQDATKSIRIERLEPDAVELIKDGTDPGYLFD